MFSKSLPVVAAIFLCASGFADAPGAQSGQDPQGLERRISTEMGGKNPTARGCPHNTGFYGVADFLWWRAENHGFSYAYNRVNDTVNSGKIVRITPDWDPGFRLGFGWNGGYDYWDVLFNWTWYHNKSTQTNFRDDLVGLIGSNQGFYPQWPVAATTTIGPYNDVRASWRLRFNAVDMELGRAMYLTKAFAFRPHWGVRAAWIDQRFRDHFRGALQLNQDEFKFFGKNNYWGVGPRTGMNGEWHLGKGFSVLGKIAGALLYGQTRIMHRSEQIPTGAAAFDIVNQFSEHFDQLVPNLQMLFGLQWGSCFRCDKMYFGVNVCWEANYWWNQFNIPVALENYRAPLPTVGNQPVTMEGLTLNTELDF
jgi:hypothetical protein